MQIPGVLLPAAALEQYEGVAPVFTGQGPLTGTSRRAVCPKVMRWLTLRNVGIAGAVIGLFALVAKPLGIWFEPVPVATIDSPTMHGQVGRCFVARGRLEPKTIWRPLWLITAEASKRWHEIGRVDTAQTTWAGRICLDGEPGAEHRLALIVADDSLDAEFSRLVHPDEETEQEIPEWLKPRKCGDQGGCGRRHCCRPLPEGATLVTAVDVTGPGQPYAPFFLGRSSDWDPIGDERPRKRARP